MLKRLIDFRNISRIKLYDNKIYSKKYIMTVKIIPAKKAFEKNSKLLSEIYTIGILPIGISCGVSSGIYSYYNFNIMDNKIRLMYGSAMGLIGFGAGISIWILWPIIFPISIGTYLYDRYYEKLKYNNK